MQTNYFLADFRCGYSITKFCKIIDFSSINFCRFFLFRSCSCCSLNLSLVSLKTVRYRLYWSFYLSLENILYIFETKRVLVKTCHQNNKTTMLTKISFYRGKRHVFETENEHFFLYIQPISPFFSSSSSFLLKQHLRIGPILVIVPISSRIIENIINFCEKQIFIVNLIDITNLGKKNKKKPSNQNTNSELNLCSISRV